MGGTNSVISRSYVYEKLNEEQKEKYAIYERECQEKGMSENQINDFMAVKYSEVFGMNPETLSEDTVSLSESLSSDSEVRMFDVITTPNGSLELTIRPESNIADAEQQELLKEIAEAYAELEAVSDFESINDGYEEEMIEQLFVEVPEISTEPNKFCCVTCNLEFETEHLLNTHVNHSEIHKTAVEKRSKTFKEGKRTGRRLSLIAMDAIMRLNDLLKHSHSHSPTSEQVPRLKSAVHRAMTKKITSHYEKVAENMFFSPKDVKLMHSETKLFILAGGASATYDIRMYLHYDLHCIEVISHLLKNAPDPRSALKAPGPEVDTDSFDPDLPDIVSMSLSFAAGNSYKGGGGAGGHSRASSGQYSPGSTPSSRKLQNFRHLSFGYQMSLADAGLLPTNAMHHNIEVIEMPRIYLEYNAVLDVVMGLNSQFNSLESVSEVPEPQYKNAPPGSLSPRTEAKINHVGNRSIGGVTTNMTIDDCIIAFVNSHLKCKCGSGKRIKEMTDYEIVFSGVNTNVQINPPRNLIAQAAASEKTILVQWEASWINLTIVMFFDHPDENVETNVSHRASKASVREKRLERRELDKKPKKVKEDKKVAVQPWMDIFQAGKIVVSMNPRNFENPELMIRHAQIEFLQTVGYSAEDVLGMPFDIVLGQASIRLNTYRMQNAILMGKSCCEYNNLYRRDGVMLSCHLTIQSITGSSSSDERSGREKWAVITVRSASVVGNSKQNGVGLLGIERIPAQVLERTIGNRVH